MTGIETHADDDQRAYGFLASAIAGRTVEVVLASVGEPTWTDGRTIVVDPTLAPSARREALVVQAALIGAGSLAPETMRGLLRRRGAARRYLSTEAQRALAAVEDILPRSLAHMADADVPRLHLGTLRPRRVLAVLDRAQDRATLSDTSGPPSGAGTDLADLMDHYEIATDPEADVLSIIPTGNNGTLVGRLLRRLLDADRTGEHGDGAPGGEGLRLRSVARERTSRSSASSVRLVGAMSEVERIEQGVRHPEWDAQLGRYRPDWCTVKVVEPDQIEGEGVPAEDLGLRRPLAKLGTGADTRHRQRHGDDIDIDAAVESKVALLTSLEPDDAVYLATVRDRRDLSVLVLMDISGSVSEPGVGRVPVHVHQRRVAAALARTLHQLGDRVAVYAYQSRGRHDVVMTAVERFGGAAGEHLLRRLHGLRPSGYSRLGAAVRHGARILEEEGGTTRRLLVVLSDGLAFDHGYERRHGAEDVRRALAEVRARGTGCLCLTVGTIEGAEDLERVFGTAAHAVAARPEQLAPVIETLFRSALRSAEIRRSSNLTRTERIAI